MSVYITPDDFTKSLPTADPARLAEVIADAEAFAKLSAPGIKAATFLADADKMAAVKAVLRAAIIYNVETAARTGPQDPGAYRPSTLLSKGQVEALRALTRGTVAMGGVYSLSLSQPDTLGR